LTAAGYIALEIRAQDLPRPRGAKGDTDPIAAPKCSAASIEEVRDALQASMGKEGHPPDARQPVAHEGVEKSNGHLRTTIVVRRNISNVEQGCFAIGRKPNVPRYRPRNVGREGLRKTGHIEKKVDRDSRTSVPNIYGSHRRL
jgi:pyruvate/2-oxoglutarate dehydrogenase complex dihydrolipoamide dehydrogenase (E3) component